MLLSSPIPMEMRLTQENLTFTNVDKQCSTTVPNCSLEGLELGTGARQAGKVTITCVQRTENGVAQSMFCC